MKASHLFLSLFALVALLAGCTAGNGAIQEDGAVAGVSSGDGRGEIFQGGDGIRLAVQSMAKQFFRAARRLKAAEGRLKPCQYAGCPPGRSSLRCSAMRAIAEDPADRQVCENFVASVLDSWIALADANDISFDIGGDLPGVLARTKPGQTIVFDEKETAELLVKDPDTVFQVVIHELTHHALLADGTYPEDEGEGRRQIDLAALGMLFLAKDSDVTDAVQSISQGMALRIHDGPGGLSPNWAGKGEIWLRAELDRWVYVMPNGALYRWNESSNALEGDEKIADLSPLYHQEPSLLVNPIAEPGQTESVRQSQLAAFLDKHYGLYIAASGLALNFLGQSEKWLMTKNTPTWVYITPDGSVTLFREHAGTRALGNIGTTYYDDPAVLVGAGTP